MQLDYEFLALQEAVNYRRAILREFSSGLKGEVLEVGCGVGQISQELLSRPGITRLTCLEPDSQFLVEHARNAPGAELIHGIARDYATRFTPDCIVSVNVLEHIEDDQEELGLYRRMLSAREGTLCLLVPACPELYAPIDRKFGHFRRYHHRELRQKLQAAGFKTTDLHYLNSVGYIAWALVFKGLGRTAFDPHSVRFYDRWIFPWVHRLETTLCRPPRGQSLVALAR
ncbi:class I SAM-dependent methyltransferase [Methylotetracoccus oryzae]|uniref:class I SAM-dependent methyltransferase n=1 Tax=Methylotetracoccus oryzae TaxID=1919059 RepID=UPI0013A59D99|nr:class I SAM-dependent methyltransferase [Methylotetracoccus oryzae]